MLSREEAIRIFIDSGALMEGHFMLTSGRHSNQYMQCAQVLQYPEYTMQLAKHIAEKFLADKIEIVVGPAMGGIVLAYEVARQLGTRAMFTERQEGTMVMRRGFALCPGQRVLVVEDVITTGGSVWEVIDIVKKSGAEVAGVAVLVDRSNGRVDFKVKQEAVLSMNIESYEADVCPLCREGRLPVIKPGSRA